MKNSSMYKKTLGLAVKESKALMIKAEKIKIYRDLLDKISSFIYYDRESRRVLDEELRELKRATMILRGHLDVNLTEVYQKIFGWGCMLSDEDSSLKLELQKFALEAIVVEDEVPWRLLNDHNSSFYDKDAKEFKNFIQQIEKKRTQKITKQTCLCGVDPRVKKIEELEKQIKNLHSQIVADYITSPDEETRNKGVKYIKENNLKDEED